MKRHSRYRFGNIVFVLAGLFLSHPAWVCAQGGDRAPESNVEGMVTVILVPAPGPPAWGKHVKGSSAELKLPEKSKGVVYGTIRLWGLEAGKNYWLCLNGKVGCAGNEELTKFGIHGKEGKYDFQSVRFIPEENEEGEESDCVTAKIEVRDLPASPYNVKFFVKEIAAKGVIVLYSNEVRFEVLGADKEGRQENTP